MELIKTPPPQFDTNLDLFSCNNLAVELNSGLVRKLVPHDYVTIATTYDYDPEASPDVVDKVFTDIYPVPEERDLVRKFAAYCLTGRTDHKTFMVLTDRRSGG